MNKTIPLVASLGALLTIGMASACPVSPSDLRIQITTNKQVYHENDTVEVSILADRSDVAESANVVDERGVGIRVSVLSQNGAPIRPNAPIEDKPPISYWSGTAPVLSLQQYLDAHPDAFVQITHRSLDTLGYKDLPPGDYTLSLAVKFAGRDKTQAPAIVTTNCVRFRIVP